MSYAKGGDAYYSISAPPSNRFQPPPAGVAFPELMQGKLVRDQFGRVKKNVNSIGRRKRLKKEEGGRSQRRTVFSNSLLTSKKDIRETMVRKIRGKTNIAVSFRRPDYDLMRRLNVPIASKEDSMEVKLAKRKNYLYKIVKRNVSIESGVIDTIFAQATCDKVAARKFLDDVVDSFVARYNNSTNHKSKRDVKVSMSDVHSMLIHQAKKKEMENN